MTKKFAILGIVASLMAAAAVAVAAMTHGAGKFEWNSFYPWVLAPYAILTVVFGLPGGQGNVRALAGCVAAVLVLLATAWFYIGAMWFSASSTSALIFIFTPGFLLAGALVVWGVAWFSFARIFGTK